jgi:hypothetical protein
MTPDQFYTQLLAIVKPGTPECLQWSSESDYPVEVVQYRIYYALLRGPMKQNGRNVRPFDLIAREGMTPREVALAHLFAKWHNYPQYVYTIPTGQPSEYVVYLLVHFADEAVGISYRVIET